MRTKQKEICLECKKEKFLTREWCGACYSKLMRLGKISKLEKKIHPETLTTEQNLILNGLMLGDGNLFIHNKKYQKPTLRVRRAATDFSYLIENYQKFKDFCNIEPKINQIFDKRTKKFYSSCVFATVGCIAFREHYYLWYPNHKKTIPENIELHPLTCAIWFCDDGCVVKNKKGTYTIKLSTHGFTKKENLFLIEKLNSIIGNGFHISKDDGCFYIRGAEFVTQKFINYIKDYIPKSMTRKITWDEKFLTKKCNLPSLKNRNINNLNDKELLILNSLSTACYKTATQIGVEINWLTGKGRSRKVATGLPGYLKRMKENGYVETIGVPNSYTNTIRYKLTKKGLNIKNDKLP